MERKVFFGIGAHYVSGTEPTITVHANMYQGHSPASTLALDLRRSPEGAARGDCKWDEIEVDDRGLRHDHTPLVLPMRDPNGTYTSPPEGVHVTTVGDPADLDREGKGAVYLERGFFKKNAGNILTDSSATWPPGSFEEYELVTVAYSNDRIQNPVTAGLRFVGMKAMVVKQQGSLVKVYLNAAPLGLWKGPFWLDLSDVDDCDPTPLNPGDQTDPLNGYPFVGTGVKVGAIMIRMERLSTLHSGSQNARGPKLPVGSG